MPYPSEERLKNLIEQVRDLAEPDYYAPSGEDTVWHGVVKEIIAGAGGAYGYLKVCPLAPAIDANGHLDFLQGVDPLTNVTATTRFDNVYVIDVAKDSLSSSYATGDLIKYWRYNGTGGTNTDKIRGTYVTLLGGANYGQPQYQYMGLYEFAQNAKPSWGFMPAHPMDV